MNTYGKNNHTPGERAAVASGSRFGAWEVIDGWIVHLNTAHNDDWTKKPRYAFVRAHCRACNRGTEKYVRVSHLLEDKTLSCCKAPRAICEALEWGA